EAYRLMGIVDHCRVMIAWPEAILEDERRYAARVCPLRDLLALMVHGQRTVAAAGTDDHACAGAFRRGRKINRQRGTIFLLIPKRSRSSLGPEQLGTLSDCRQCQQEKQNPTVYLHSILRATSLADRALSSPVDFRHVEPDHTRVQQYRFLMDDLK